MRHVTLIFHAFTKHRTHKRAQTNEEHEKPPLKHHLFPDVIALSLREDEILDVIPPL